MVYIKIFSLPVRVVGERPLPDHGRPRLPGRAARPLPPRDRGPQDAGHARGELGLAEDGSRDPRAHL